LREDLVKKIKWMFRLIMSAVGAYIFISLTIMLFSAGGKYAIFGLILIGGLFLVILRAFFKKKVDK